MFEQAQSWQHERAATSAVLEIEKGATGQDHVAEARVKVPARVQPAGERAAQLGKPSFSEREMETGAVRVGGVCILDESVPSGRRDPCELRLVAVLANKA